MTQRANTHQTHLEDLVVLGPDGLDEIEYKLNNLVSEDMNYSTKIDASPASVLWSHIEGYPDNSVCLKSFINGPTNALSSEEAIEEKYGERPEMCAKLKACLELSKSIPAGEAWQADCLFTVNSLKPLNILGKEYLTFQPNKIIYAISEDSPSYEKIAGSTFGICFHTIYKGSAGHFSQSFKVDLNRLNNILNDFYVMTPTLEKPKEIKNEQIELLTKDFLRLKSKLVSDSAYKEITENVMFMKYWNIFENKSISDKAVITLNLDTFEDDLIEFIDERLGSEYEKKQSTLKTDKGREKAKNAYEQSLAELNDLVNNNHDTLKTMVECLNTVALIKMEIMKAFPSLGEFTTFFNSASRGYIPTSGEGISMSDSEGNIVKLVDRSTFSNANRDNDILRGFDESLNEKLEGESRTAVVAFGRMNPPTIGHYKLIKTLTSIEGDSLLYLSHSQDKKKNPLDYDTKLKFCQEAFPEVTVVNSETKTLVNVLEELNGKYTDIVYVCGSDRLEGPYSADKVLTAYNNKPDKSGKINYSFNSINFVSAGDRDADSDDVVETISGSMARQFAIDNDFNSFEDIVPFEGEKARELFNAVRKGLGLAILKEELLDPDKSKIKSQINNLLISNPSIEVKQTSSRHPLEVARIKPLGISDVELINIVKDLLADEFENIIIGDYDYYGEASHTFKALKISVDEHSYYITVSTKAKKEFTPIRLLDDLDNQEFNYSDLYEYIHYDKDSEVEDILRTLAQEATTATSNDTLTVQNNLEYKESDSFTFAFGAPETIKKLRAINPEKFKLIESGIKVDFAEVFGACGLAASIDKAVGGDIKIIYPSASNAKLLDYTIAVNKDRYRVSAKTGGGAKPASTSMFESIHKFLEDTNYENPDLEYGRMFCDWFYENVTKCGVNDSYVNIEYEIINIINGDYSGWRHVFKGIPELNRLSELCNKDPFNEKVAKDLVATCNELARNLGGNIVKPINDNYRKHLDQYMVKCLVGVFVNVINATHTEAEDGLIDQVNELFKKSFGSLIQVYAHPNLDKGYFTFDVKYLTENTGRYKFNNNIGLDQSGRFTNQKLAIELVK